MNKREHQVLTRKPELSTNMARSSSVARKSDKTRETKVFKGKKHRENNRRRGSVAGKAKRERTKSLWTPPSNNSCDKLL